MSYREKGRQDEESMTDKDAIPGDCPGRSKGHEVCGCNNFKGAIDPRSHCKWCGILDASPAIATPPEPAQPAQEPPCVCGNPVWRWDCTLCSNCSGILSASPTGQQSEIPEPLVSDEVARFTEFAFVNMHGSATFGMSRQPDGEWVDYEDYVDSLRTIQQLREENERLKQQPKHRTWTQYKAEKVIEFQQRAIDAEAALAAKDAELEATQKALRIACDGGSRYAPDDAMEAAKESR